MAVIPMSSGEYDVRIGEGVRTKTLRVHVGAALLAALHLGPDAGSRVVRAALEALDESDQLDQLGAFVPLERFREEAAFVEGVRRHLDSGPEA
jgi:hypothetical protein